MEQEDAVPMNTERIEASNASIRKGIAKVRAAWPKDVLYGEQTMDADCNNCAHMRRVKFDRNVEMPHVFGSPAWCSKYERAVRCQAPGIFSGRPCFVHIRTGESSGYPDPHSSEQTRFYDAFPETGNENVV